MTRQITPNIGLTYETDYNNNFSYDDDVKNNMDAVDQAIGEDRARLDKLDNPQSAPLTISERIHHIANTVYGQVSVESIMGRTITNTGGDVGDCEDLTDFEDPNGTAGLDSTSKVFGSNSIKCTASTVPFGIRALQDKFPVDSTKYYLVSAYIKSEDSLSAILRVVKGSNVGATLKDSSAVISTSFVRVGVVLQPSDLTGETSIRPYIRVSTASAGQTVSVDGIMVNEITASEYAEGATALLSKYNYVNGTKSTISALRFLSHSKNFLKGYDENISVNYYNESGKYKDLIIKVEKNNDMVMKLYNANIPASCSVVVRKYSDPTVSLATFNTNGDVTNTFNTASEEKVIVRFYNGADSPLTYDKAQLELGTTATDWVKYDESISYIYAVDENGNIIEMHELPNGTKDEVSDGKLYKRTNKYVLQSGDITSLDTSDTNVDVVAISKPLDFVYCNKALSDVTVGAMTFENYQETDFYNVSGRDDVANIGKYSNRISTSLIHLVVTKGTYVDLAAAQADLAGTTLIYQLATEKVYDLAGIETLKSFEGETTLIIEPAIRFEAIADSSGQITIPNSELYIDYIESVEEVIISGESISYTDASYSEVDTTTIGSLTYGTKYRVVYHYPSELTTIPTLTYSYSMNTAGSIKDLFEIVQKLEEELGSVWITLLPLADKELSMYAITVIPDTSTATTQEIGDKINEILNVWR